jgi:hypothetical protein
MLPPPIPSKAATDDWPTTRSVGSSTPPRNDVIIRDEVGFAPLDDTGAQLRFRLVTAAYERRSFATASRRSFD